MIRLINKNLHNEKEKFEEMTELIADETAERVHKNLGHHHSFGKINKK